MSTKKVVDPVHAKSKAYQKILKKIQAEGQCPFCPQNFKYHPKPILKKDNNWFITHNTWPYKNTQHHFIIISKSHKEKFNELNLKDFQSVQKLTNWAIKKYSLKGAALTLRFGDTNHTGATVYHLHFHLITPKINLKTKRAKIVNFPIG